ncbi:glycoside hydrolase family 3 C-terminal domain-containing protein [Streptomyces sp. G44]|uniref:glycoside hydrolase family 3 N-terminal domain-containing protein n=1 Tax=Streptomyces sp. G44 TaxID=2807632 RepID=UPI00196189E4|nr:glycoside hydrolase family 3 N-terminal domain-containing protein [Streptomyces sp. G44]MBM7169541.1 glycoside hydrolase family 3 C-terminal domain-containing protein [Streptomyces sp. G44]
MRDVRRRTLLSAIGATTAAVGAAGAAETGPAHAAPGRPKPAVGPHDDRVRKLLDRMTVEEKLGQLQQLPWGWDTGPGGGASEAVKKAEDAARAGRLGSVLSIFGARTTNALQRVAVEESRLGIPLVFGLDVIHGFWTTFPIPLAQAASFDPEVARTDGEVSAGEARSNGVHWTFSPMMDVTHEPRWGRVAEGSGEDPYLTAAFAAAKVRGYQGEPGEDGSAAHGAKDRVAACAKHFVAYGGAEGGRDYNTVDVSESRLRNLYLPPFKAALEAGAATVMASFNTISGVPAHGNSHTLTGILKQEWGFDGVVVSDWSGVQELIPHGFAVDGAAAARLALNAGVDMEMTSTHLLTHGRKLLREGGISGRRLDDAVARVLRLKFDLGLFDHPYVDEGDAVGGPTAATRAAARKAAARSMVLLKNDDLPKSRRRPGGKGKVLPLEPSLRSIAVVGPFGDSDDLLGTWSFPAAVQKYPAVKVLDAVRRAAPGAKVTYARGMDAEGEDTGGLRAAVAAAKAAEVTVVVVGEPPAMSGEAASRGDIGLPGGQEELVAAVAATGKPFVVVLVNGRPLTMSGWLHAAPAVLEAWHPGLEAGNAIADVLFGEVVPGGKLPVSFPRAVGQIPVHYNHESTGRPYDAGNKYSSKYLDLPPDPQFPFGHGLSYTTFEIGEPRLSRERIAARALRRGDTLEVSVSVTNTGDRAGDEVVQLYVHDLTASITQPVRKLRGFRRVTLKPGASRTVRFRIGADDLGFWTNERDGEFRVEEGAVDLYVGGSSRATAKRRLTVT